MKIREELSGGRGCELVHNTARLCAMNMMLHGISADSGTGQPTDVPIVVADSLAADPRDRYDIVLTNPPVGKMSSTTMVAEDGKVAGETDIIERDDDTVRRKLLHECDVHTLLCLQADVVGTGSQRPLAPVQL